MNLILVGKFSSNLYLVCFSENDLSSLLLLSVSAFDYHNTRDELNRLGN